MDMIIFEESGQITPDMWDAVRRYDKSGGWPAEPMSKQDICYRRREGLWLHSWYGERDRLVHELATRLFA